MIKSFKNYFLIFISFLFTFILFTYSPNAMSDVHIVEDSKNTKTLPKNFRKTSDLSSIENISYLNLAGLHDLNISGSSQFTEFNLPLIKESINNNFNIIDIDLREESHGFINGIAISFANSDNNANKGLTYNEIINKENEDLASIKLNEPLTFYNKNKEIIPEKVQNELDLTKDNNISYLRIPVTDGGLPNEDMVNSFIAFVNKQPENTWLHFHCKAGVGRTTTFMIMYDIMKNCNNVSLDDIIKRQVLLANLSKKTSQDFFMERRYTFLNDFYTKCKNDKSINTSSNSIISANNLISTNNDSYIKNTKTPKFLYVISEKDMTSSEQTMIVTLQGLISSKCDKQIYILSPSEPDYEIWLNDLKNNYNVKYKTIKDPWKLLDIFKSYIDGYVLYSSVKSPSINNACTLASLKNSIAIDESIEAIINNHGITNLIKDCRDTDKYWAYNNLWDLGLNHSTVIELSANKFMSLRDYAIMSKSLIFYEDDINDTSFRETIFDSMDDGGHILGWGPDEHTNVSIASKCGVDMIAADWSYNLSVLSSYPSNPKFQKSYDEFIEDDGVHYVTFIMSDGDNQQWLLGSNYSVKNWFGSPYRGKFNLGWSISPSIYYLAPTVFNKYYETASHSKYTDNFVVPASGNGYIYPSKFPFEKLSDYTNRLNNYMNKVDQHYVLILDDEAFYKKDLWDKYTSNSNINGLLYLNYNKNNSYSGKIIWSNDKPVVSCRDLLWEGLEDQTELINNINTRVNLGYTDIKNPNSYTFVYVHVWSNTMDNVNDVITKLNKNPKVRVVTPENFMELIEKNVPHIDT